MRILAMNIGLRAAARTMGLSEERTRQWASRGKWGISTLPIVRIPGPTAAAMSPNVTPAHEVIASVVQHYGDRAKIGACIAGSKALEHLADQDGSKLVSPAAAISGDQWTKAVDRAAGWTQARAQGVSVQVAVINPPSEAERQERRAVHAALDAIARRLSAP